MKSVMISIQPQWCELIARGEKTVEVRKTAPKLQTPFKCYIYCTKGHFHKEYSDTAKAWKENALGKVIGEFVCDKIFDICIEISKLDDLSGYPFPGTGLTDKEIVQYLKNGKAGCGWHISNLVIYDEPKPLSEFYRCGAVSMKDLDEELCIHCAATDYGEKRACHTPDGAWMCEGRWCDEAYQEYLDEEFSLTRAPQSWCYVEEL